MNTSDDMVEQLTLLNNFSNGSCFLVVVQKQHFDGVQAFFASVHLVGSPEEAQCFVCRSVRMFLYSSHPQGTVSWQVTALASPTVQDATVVMADDIYNFRKQYLGQCDSCDSFFTVCSTLSNFNCPAFFPDASVFCRL